MKALVGAFSKEKEPSQCTVKSPRRFVGSSSFQVLSEVLPVLAGPGGGEVWVQGGGLLAPRVAALQRRHEQRAEGRAELAAVIMIRSG